jgi:predicted nucleotidyltransferase
MRRLSLLDLIRIERQLEELLGTDVDLVEEGTLKDGIRERVDQEAVRAF